MRWMTAMNLGTPLRGAAEMQVLQEQKPAGLAERYFCSVASLFRVLALLKTLTSSSETKLLFLHN